MLLLLMKILYDERDERVLYAANNPDIFSKSVDRYLTKQNTNLMD